MVLDRSCGHEGATCISDHPAYVSVEFGTPGIIDPWLPIAGAEDDVDENLGK